MGSGKTMNDRNGNGNGNENGYLSRVAFFSGLSVIRMGISFVPLVLYETQKQKAMTFVNFNVASDLTVQ